MKVFIALCLAVGLSAAQIDLNRPFMMDREKTVMMTDMDRDRASSSSSLDMSGERLLCDSRLKMDERCLSSLNRDVW